ncbi:hypothetical protein [Flavobacterium sp.]|uniref:hypothetical protein n=1 Tax=Flavobacterium sp. TaxID=239 RepID=UPI003BEB08F0
MKKLIVTSLLFSCQLFFAQSNIETILKSGELIISGLSIIKAKGNPNSKTIESVCIKNKLTEKITIKITGKDEDGKEIKKELIIQNDGKECFLELLKGIYTYEIILSNKDTYKKGEYKFDDDVVITIKDN